MFIIYCMISVFHVYTSWLHVYHMLHDFSVSCVYFMASCLSYAAWFQCFMCILHGFMFIICCMISVFHVYTSWLHVYHMLHDFSVSCVYIMASCVSYTVWFQCFMCILHGFMFIICCMISLFHVYTSWLHVYHMLHDFIVSCVYIMASCLSYTVWFHVYTSWLHVYHILYDFSVSCVYIMASSLSYTVWFHVYTSWLHVYHILYDFSVSCVYFMASCLSYAAWFQCFMCIHHGFMFIIYCMISVFHVYTSWLHVYHMLHDFSVSCVYIMASCLSYTVWFQCFMCILHGFMFIIYCMISVFHVYTSWLQVYHILYDFSVSCVYFMASCLSYTVWFQCFMCILHGFMFIICCMISVFHVYTSWLHVYHILYDFSVSSKPFLVFKCWHIKADTKWLLFCREFFNFVLWHKNCHLCILISLKFVLKDPINNKSSLIPISKGLQSTTMPPTSPTCQVGYLGGSVICSLQFSAE